MAAPNPNSPRGPSFGTTNRSPGDNGNQRNPNVPTPNVPGYIEDEFEQGIFNGASEMSFVPSKKTGARVNITQGGDGLGTRLTGFNEAHHMEYKDMDFAAIAGGDVDEEDLNDPEAPAPQPTSMQHWKNASYMTFEGTNLQFIGGRRINKTRVQGNASYNAAPSRGQARGGYHEAEVPYQIQVTQQITATSTYSAPAPKALPASEAQQFMGITAQSTLRAPPSPSPSPIPAAQQQSRIPRAKPTSRPTSR